LKQSLFREAAEAVQYVRVFAYRQVGMDSHPFLVLDCSVRLQRYLQLVSNAIDVYMHKSGFAVNQLPIKKSNHKKMLKPGLNPKYQENRTQIKRRQASRPFRRRTVVEWARTSGRGPRLTLLRIDHSDGRHVHDFTDGASELKDVNRLLQDRKSTRLNSSHVKISY